MTSSTAATTRVDGVEAAAVETPGDAEEVARLLQSAGEQGLVVVPRGGGTRLSYGYPPQRVDMVLEVGELDGIVAHAADDLTVTAQAGITLAHLQRQLAMAGQWLPIDPPGDPERSTLGGILMTDACGASQPRHGRPADLLLGTQAARMDGTLARAGGRVVKNVAGYEMGRLYCGSLGTLTVLTEATLRVAPLPREPRTLVFPLSDEAAAVRCFGEIRGWPLAPRAATVVGPGMGALLGLGPEAAPGGWLLVALGGTEAARRPYAELARQAAGNEAVREPEEETDAALWLALRTAPARASLALRANLLPARLDDLWPAVAGLPAHRGYAHPLSGLLRVFLDVAEQPEAGALEAVGRFAAAVVGAGGHLALEWAPVAWRRAMPVWQPLPEGLPMMRELKRRFDPRGVLNRGRFLPGLEEVGPRG